MSFTRLGQVCAEMQSIEEGLISEAHTPTVSSVEARSGTYSFRSNNVAFVGIGFESQSQVRCGVHFYFNSGSSCWPLFFTSIGQAFTGNFGIHLDVTNSEVDLIVDGSIVQSKTFTECVVAPGEWTHWGMVYDGTLSRIAVWCNNIRIFNYTGAFTSTTVNGAWSGTNALGGGNDYSDDLYADAFVGESVTEKPPKKFFLFKTGDGVGGFTQWTPVNDAPNWRCIDDPATHDGDSTYNQAASGDLVDTFLTTPFSMPTPVSGTINVVRACIPQYIVKRNDILQDAKIRAISYNGVVLDYGDTHDYIGPGYQMLWHRFDRQPDGSSWNEDDINDMEFGYQSQGTFNSILDDGT